MKKNPIIFRSIVVASLVSMVLFTACGSAKPTPTPTPIPEPTATSTPAPVEGNVNVLAYAGLADSEAFTAPFYARYPDATLNFTYMTSDQDAFTKIQSGAQVDVFGSNWMKIYVDNDLVMPIDTSRIEAWSSIPDALKARGNINGVQYFVPIGWLYASILVRTDKVTTMPTSWADLWNPEYRGHVAITDGAEAAVVFTSTALGYDPYNLTDVQFEAVKQKLIELQPNLLMYWSDPYAMIQSVADGDLWVVGGSWNGPYALAVSQGLPVAYIDPTEGRYVIISGMGIPKNAQNVDAAYAYINTELSDDIQKIYGAYYYGVANWDTLPLLDQNLVQLMGLDNLTVLDSGLLLKDVSLAEMNKWNAMYLEVKTSQ